MFLRFKSKEIQEICNSKLLQNTQLYQSDETAFDHIYHRSFVKHTSELYYS